MIGTRGRALVGILLRGIVTKLLFRNYSEMELYGWLGLAIKEKLKK
ncbi:MAG: hypothetical protein HQ561_08730 [Desulfobacteraceae bacterium]|nr:hypothetical protein [Desulfobacteraceae bacterium]